MAVAAGWRASSWSRFLSVSSFENPLPETSRHCFSSQLVLKNVAKVGWQEKTKKFAAFKRRSGGRLRRIANGGVVSAKTAPADFVPLNNECRMNKQTCVKTNKRANGGVNEWIYGNRLWRLVGWLDSCQNDETDARPRKVTKICRLFMIDSGREVEATRHSVFNVSSRYIQIHSGKLKNKKMTVDSILVFQLSRARPAVDYIYLHKLLPKKHKSHF